MQAVSLGASIQCFFIIHDKQCQKIIYDLLTRVEGQAVPLGGSLQCFFLIPDKQYQEVLYGSLMRVEGQAVSFGASLQCPHYTWLQTLLPDFLPMFSKNFRAVRPAVSFDLSYIHTLASRYFRGLVTCIGCLPKGERQDVPTDVCPL